MTKRLLFLDFETYYDKEYSLRKMTPAEYILDKRYETILMAVKEETQPARVIDEPDIADFLRGYDPAETITVTYNALFDNCILAWHYGFVPSLMLDALGMARAILGQQLKSLSLASVSEHLGLGQKGDALANVIGLRRSEIKRYHHILWEKLCHYAIQDVNLCAKIFAKLYPEFPESERRVMDLVLRCAVEPKFVLDQALLISHYGAIRKEKEELLARVGVDQTKLMSADKFAALLAVQGVEVEYKTSPTGRKIPCLAKTDKFLNDLAEHENPMIQALAAARLGLKSTLEETRCEKLWKISNLPWQNYRDGNVRLYSGGNMPVPLRYSGAHTHRLSGDWKLNMQNLPTERGSKGKSKLRHSLTAPPDHQVVVADLAQIEARLVAWLAGARLLLDQFANKKDPYAALASEIFGREIDRKIHIPEGFIGKTGILGCGYGCGVDKFFNMVKTSSRTMGVDLGNLWTLDLAQKTVGTYRRVHREIPQLWSRYSYHVENTLRGKVSPSQEGPVTIHNGHVLLPNGLKLKYGNVTFAYASNGTSTCSYEYGGRPHRIYGPKLLENVTQALARVIVMNAALRLADRGFRLVLQAHDELVFIVHKDLIEPAKKIIYAEMTRRPSWAPDLPLDASVGHGPTYGDAK